MKNLLTLLFILVLSACTKNDPAEDQLPPATTTGANTAGCIVNGKVIIPKNGINSTTGQLAYGLRVYRGVTFDSPPFGNDYFAIMIANLESKGNSYWIYIHINNMSNGIGLYNVGQSNGEFFIDGPNNPQIIVRETYNNISGKTFLSSPNSGKITISRFDFQNSVMSCLFDCTLYNVDNPNEKIQVTDGRFDLKI